MKVNLCFSAFEDFLYSRRYLQLVNMSILNEKSYFTYSTVPQDDKNVESGYKTAFDYDSIFSYASPFKTEQEGNAKPAAGEKSADTISPEGISGKIISVLALVCSYLVIFFTLPVTVWFCFKNLPQWERIVVYRLGKLRGVKCPGNVFVIPLVGLLYKTGFTHSSHRPPSQTSRWVSTF